jgi:hypothetical protein
MKKIFPFAIFFIAAHAVSTGAMAQKVYKCGATYSQIPCEGAVTVEAQDVRTLNQKSQAEAVTARDTATANAMEKARLKEEALAAGKAMPAKKAASKTGKTDEVSGNGTLAGQKKPAGKHNKGAPELFTAKTVPEKPKKTSPTTP